MHSEQSNSTPITHPSIHPPFELKKHIKDSWALMAERLLPMILVLVLTFVVTCILLIVAVLIGGLLFVGSPEFVQMLQSESLPPIEQAVTMFQEVLSQLGILALVVLLSISYLSSAFGTALILIIASVRKVSFGEAISVGFQKGIAVLAIGFITGVLALGGFFPFMLPGFAISIMFMFYGYAYVIGKESFIGSMRRSVQMVSAHFALVLGRYLLIFFGSLAISALAQFFYQAPELISIGFIISLVGTWSLTLYSIAYFALLYRHLDQHTSKDTPVHMAWIYIVSGLGLLIISVLVYFGITQGVPFIKEQIAAEIARESDEEGGEYEFSDYIDSSCGITIPITSTYEESTGRKWIYEQRWISAQGMRGFVPEKQLTQNGVLLAMTNFKTTEQRNPETLKEGESFFYGYPGVILICTANTEELTLDEFVEQAEKSEEGTVTQAERVLLGEVDAQGIWIAGVSSNGNYYKEPYYLAVSQDGKNLIAIKLWDGDTEEVDAEVQAIYNNLTYIEEAETLKDPNIKSQQATKSTTPACQQLKIYEGEFASDKCYSAQDYKDIQYYLQAYNRAIFDYNGAVSRISIVCSGSEFFKTNCEEAQREKSDAEGKISQYKGTIQSIMARGK